jgi:lactobin A/cerein 7B family class IIb bacteriocin
MKNQIGIENIQNLQELTDIENLQINGGVSPLVIVGACFSGLGVALLVTYYVGYAVGKLSQD